MNTTADTGTYTQAIAKGGALIPETRSLLRAWIPGSSESNLARYVLDNDVLGRATERRVLDIVRVFAQRYLVPNDQAAHLLRHMIVNDSAPQAVSDLMLFFMARRDSLLRDFLALRFWPMVREGALFVRNREMQQLIREAEVDGRIPARWSEEIVRDMAGRVMIALTDFGMVRQFKPGVREVSHYRMSDGAIAVLSYLFHEQQISDQSIAEQPAWGWFGLLPSDVLHRLDELTSQRHLILQRAGQVVRITWTHGSLKEAVNALAG